MSFLPDFPLSINQFGLFGLILLSGLIGGELAARSRVLPRIAGYLAVGLAIGPLGFNWLSAAVLRDIQIFIDISLGLVLFELGRRVDRQWLWHDPSLWRSALLEGGLTFLLLLGLLLGFGFAPLPAALAACIGMVTSPAVVIMVARDLRAEGVLTRRVLTLAALGNVLGLTLFTLLLPFTQAEGQPLLHGLYRLFGSLTLGAAMFALAALLARLTGKHEASQFVLLVAMVVIAIALARVLNLSVMLSLLAFGIAARNLDQRRRLMAIDFGLLGLLFMILLFVIIGASLRLDGFASAGFVVVAFLLVRTVGKSAGVLLFTNAAGQTRRQGVLTAMALTPMAGVALGMTRSVADFNPDLGLELGLVVLAAIAVLDLLGPVMTQWALRQSGEACAESRS